MDLPAPRLVRFQLWLRAVDTRIIDALIGTTFTVLGLTGLLLDEDPHNFFRSPNALAVALALACSLPYFFRRRAPLAVLLVNTVALVILSVMKFPANVQSQMILIGAYTVGAYCTERKRVIGLSALGAGVALVAIVGIPDSTSANLALTGAIYTAAYLFGSTVRNRRLYTDQLEERSALLVRESEEEAKRAIADERLRIAQELHDVVAHSMGVIAVQAGVGEHVIDQDPVEAKKALAAIATTSRSTLTEIRRLLGVLRQNDGAEHAPAPGLADLPRLMTDFASAGLQIERRLDGGPFDLPPGVDLTAYRIVQEALTNVLKHAGPAIASVAIAMPSPGVLRLEITDDGRGVNGRAPTGGHGLLGIRERVAIYGGTLETGPRTGGGYRVSRGDPVRGTRMIRVAVADDQALVRSGFSVLLRSAGDIDVVGEAGTGREALELVRTHRPDVVLMDIRMPEMDGLEATALVTAESPETRVLILTTFDLDEYVFQALRAGASGFLLKDTRPEELLAAVRVLADGEALLAPSVTRRLIEQFVTQQPASGAAATAALHHAIGTLTERELEVLVTVARGCSNAEIAAELFMSHATAKTHVSRLLTKLDARDRAQLVVIAYEAGVATPGGTPA